MATSSTSSTTSASTATTSLVTQLGGGSGIDMTALANNLATAQFSSRNSTLTAKADTLDARISVASSIKSMMLTLDTSLGTLVRSGSLAPVPTIANGTVATTALSGSSTPSGAYSLEVTKLATGQRIASSAYSAASSPVGSGTLTIRFGTLGTTFTQDNAHAALNLTIAQGATLADVANQINGANAGVLAYVANTAQGAQLVFKGTEGAANGFVVDIADANDTGLSKLGWSPTSGTGVLLQSAGNAAFKLDGLEVTATSNTVTDAIPGVKLQLTGTSAGAPTSVSFANPGTSVSSSMQDLVDALNEVASTLNSATALGGDLVNDAGAKALRKSLSALASATIMPNATSTAKTLGDLGLKLERDGTFTLDTARLSATQAADPRGVLAMFTTGVHGVYATVDKIYRSTTSSADSNSLGSSISRYTKQKAQISQDKTELADKQEKLRTQLLSRFTTAETRISTFNSTKSMLENQIAQWNKSSN